MEKFFQLFDLHIYLGIFIYAQVNDYLVKIYYSSKLAIGCQTFNLAFSSLCRIRASVSSNFDKNFPGCA
jgi:hypothetical protein